MSSLICKLSAAVCSFFPRLTALESAVGLALPVSIANGGTGAITAAAARVNLKLPTTVLAALDTAIDWSVTNNFFTSLVANRTFTFTNLADGLGCHIVISNTGAFTPTFPVGIIWPGLTAQPSVLPASGETVLYTLTRINGVIYGVYVLYA